MFISLFDTLQVNKQLMKIADIETAVYCGELISVLKQVIKKQTLDTEGYFILDREYIERETTLNLNHQLKCEAKLVSLGVVAKDDQNPNRIAICVSNLASAIANEDTGKLKKKRTRTTEQVQEAKAAGMKNNMKRVLLETDPEIRAAYELWIDGMVDAKNCRFTQAVVMTFENVVNEYTTRKDTKLEILRIATSSSYRDATWAINKLQPKYQTLPTEQQTGTSVSNDVSF